MQRSNRVNKRAERRQQAEEDQMTFSEAISTVSSKIADEVLTGYSMTLA